MTSAQLDQLLARRFGDRVRRGGALELSGRLETRSSSYFRKARRRAIVDLASPDSR